MARLVVPEAIRIEDEVWQEAFARKIPDRRNGGRVQRVAAAGPRLTGAARSNGSQRSNLASIAAHAPEARIDHASTDHAPTRLTPTDTRDAPAGGSAPARRTVVIRGRGAERNLPWPTEPRRRPALRAHERAGFRPDRVAMWAVMLCILVLVVAAISGHG